MRIRSEWCRKLGGLLVATGVQAVMSTLDYQQATYDPTIDLAHPDFLGPAIFLFWHEYIPVPYYLRPYGPVALLVSRHADAEWLTQSVRFRGFSVVRGSSARGGASALREMLRAAERFNLVITPDGPRGPRRTMAQGPIFLSSAMQIPLVLIAPGYDRPWRLPTWDRFAIPRPFSRCCVVGSPRIQIPPNLDRDGIEHYRGEAERLLNRLTDEAEAWAESGRPHPQGLPLRCQSARKCRLRTLEEVKLTEPVPPRQVAGPRAEGDVRRSA